jgi:hypothetical protein
MVIQLRRASCDIYGLKTIPFDIVEYLLNRFQVHGLFTTGTCVEMTMTTNLITEKAHIDLEGFCLSPPEAKTMLRQSGNERFYPGEYLRIGILIFSKRSILIHRMPFDYRSKQILCTLPYPALVMV